MKVVHNIALEAFLYPTEDLKRVRKALSIVLPEKARLKNEEVDSFYGPRIAKLTFWTDKASDIKAMLQKMITGLSKEDREAIVGTLDERMDENGSLFLRFNKQKAHNGKLVLDYKGDPIKAVIKIASFPANLNNMKYNAKIIFEG
jgi:hypothetical protein